MLPPHNAQEAFSDLPTPDSELALWAPVYWEPILLSGERLTAIVVAVGANQTISVVRCIREDVLKALFPTNYVHALSLLNWIASSLEQHLVNAGSLSEWEPPLTGFYMGEIYQAFTSNTQDLPHQVIPLCSSLSVADLSSATNVKTAYEISLDRLRASIKQSVVTSSPHLKDCFGKQILIIDGARKPTIDFIGNRTAANFARLGTSNLGRYIKDTKAQILDLVTYKERATLVKEDLYALLVWRPQGLDVKQAKQLEEAFLEIEGESNHFGLDVIPFSDPREAAQAISAAERAA